MNFFGLFFIADWFLILVFLGFALYEFLSWRYNELKELGIPGPKPSVPLGNLGDFFKLGTDCDAIYIKKYGKIFGSYICRNPQITVADLDIIRHVLVKDFDNFTDRSTLHMRGTLAHSLFDTNGQRWRTMRRKLTPAFTSGKLKLMFEMMKKCSENLVENLEEFATSGEMFEVKGVTNAFTSDNIASTCFGIELNTQKTPKHPFIRHGKEIFEGSLKNIFVLMALFMPYIAKHIEKVKPSCLPKDAENYFVDLLTEAIKVRRDNPTAKKDLIQMILDAEKDLMKLDDETKAVYNAGLGSIENDKSGLSQEEVISNLFLFLLAGYDTTSGTLSFFLYNMAIHPQVQDILAKEIENVVGEKDLTYSMMSQLTYMDKCINESMRLYPLAAKVDRICLSERQYGNLKIPEGMSVGIPIRYFHHNPELWPEPEKFDPERFSAESKAKRDPLSFMPFGQGPRMCIGNRFALLTLKVALAYIVKNFRILKCEKTEIPIKIRRDAIHLTAENGIWLRIEKRS